jgi:hypothetical protein
MVIGRDHWPSAEDEQRLLYIRAIIKEVCAVGEYMSRHVSKSLRCSARGRRFGWDNPTILLRVLCTMGCTFPRTQRFFLTVTVFTTTKRSTQTRMNPFPLIALELTFPIPSFSFNPNRYMGDTLSCAESSKLPNAMDRDHWAFGAGWVFYS